MLDFDGPKKKKIWVPFCIKKELPLVNWIRPAKPQGRICDKALNSHVSCEPSSRNCSTTMAVDDLYWPFLMSSPHQSPQPILLLQRQNHGKGDLKHQLYFILLNACSFSKGWWNERTGSGLRTKALVCMVLFCFNLRTLNSHLFPGIGHHHPIPTSLGGPDNHSTFDTPKSKILTLF